MRIRFGVVSVAVVLLGGASCGSDATPAVTLRPAQHVDHPPSVADLQSTFERLLGHHATLVCRFLRAQLDDDADFIEAAEQAVVTNTSELAAAVESVHGPDAADQFEELWVLHIELLGDYAAALRDGDEQAQVTARDRLDTYRADYGTFVQGATGGAIAADAAAENLSAHLDHLLGHADAYHAGDHGRAFELQRVAFAHMFPTGHALGGGLGGARPGELPVAADGAGQQLRSTLGRLLGEHFELAVDAMRSAVGGERDFDAVAGALNGNTHDLTAAMDALFGPERAARFNAASGAHVEPLVAYTAALAQQDEAGRAAARSRLTEAEDVLAATLGELTAGGLPVEASRSVFRSHDEQLVRQIDAYAAGDFTTAHRLSFEGYQHMFDVASTMAPAIEAALAAQRPAGGAGTGGGGTARDPGGGA